MSAVVQKNLHQVDRAKVESDIPTGYGVPDTLDFSRFKDVDFDHPSDDESMTETEEYEQEEANSIGASRGRFIEEKMRRRQVGATTTAPAPTAAAAPAPAVSVAPAKPAPVAKSPPRSTSLSAPSKASRLPRAASVAEVVVAEVAPLPVVAAPVEEPALAAAPPAAARPKSPEKPEHFDPEVAALLSGLGLAKYISAFDENEVDMEALLLMTSGINRFIHIRHSQGARDTAWPADQNFEQSQEPASGSAG